MREPVRPPETVRIRDLVRRIEAATPPGRDRAVDGLRAVAILGVVLGHWLVTALVADSGTLRYPCGSSLRSRSSSSSDVTSKITPFVDAPSRAAAPRPVRATVAFGTHQPLARPLTLAATTLGEPAWGARAGANCQFDT